jgi:hypothetical protein
MGASVAARSGASALARRRLPLDTRPSPIGMARAVEIAAGRTPLLATTTNWFGRSAMYLTGRFRSDGGGHFGGAPKPMEQTQSVSTLNALEYLVAVVERHVHQATDNGDWIALAGWLNTAGILSHAVRTLNTRTGGAI